MFEFEAFPKIPRYKRNVVVTEKIDGTNAQIAIFKLDSIEVRAAALQHDECLVVAPSEESGVAFALFAGSRNRWLVPEVHRKGGDNYGFAQWAYDNSVELIARLGPGRHFGEWWGVGIGRRYGQTGKRFSLFNTARWGAHNPPPSCCDVVPLLYQGTPDGLDAALSNLRLLGSSAAPGFFKPEGVIVYHCDSRQYYKITLEDDELPKSQRTIATSYRPVAVIVDGPALDGPDVSDGPVSAGFAPGFEERCAGAGEVVQGSDWKHDEGTFGGEPGL